ncbi:MAG TPA: STAS domain-containing protein [Kofleriaceae bacterium]|nr:STAS domain-containing protein [Kofleriaceae bacterium]
MHARLTSEVRGNHLTLAGMIDEHADLARLLEHAKDKQLVIDLGGVTFINSLGIRDWIRMQQAAQSAGIAIELRRVAEPVVHQLNIMPAARGVSMVTSFFAAYVCDDCDQEHRMLLDVRTHGSDLAKLRAPAMKCPDCQHDMDIANPPEFYFMFLAGS